MTFARYVSEPVRVPANLADAGLVRADLEFHGVDHSGSSFGARVFLGNPEADEDTPLEEGTGYAGSFYVFGHGGCFGDQGHCDVPRRRPGDAFDRRLPHPLTPQKKTVVLSRSMLDALRENAGGTLRVTVVPVASDSVVSDEEDSFRFERLSLIAYG